MRFQRPTEIEEPERVAKRQVFRTMAEILCPEWWFGGIAS